MSKSPNKHNRIYLQARPMEDGLAEAIDDGKVGPRDDPKARSKVLSEDFGWDKDLAKKIWCFGPDTTGEKKRRGRGGWGGERREKREEKERKRKKNSPFPTFSTL